MAQKKLGLTDLIAMSSGQVIGAGVVTLIGTAIACTGQAAWLAYGAAIFIGFLSIVPFILMSSTFMLKGGEYTIVANMFNEKAAVLCDCLHCPMYQLVHYGNIVRGLCRIYFSWS